MAAEQDIAIVAVDPAYTTRWGAQHWQKPLTTPRRRPSRHDAASIAVGDALSSDTRSGDGRHRPRHRSDRGGHPTAQARPDTRGVRKPAAASPDRAPIRAAGPERKRATRAPNTVRDDRGDQVWVQDSLPLSL
ncbi:hypothetical protein SVIOM74S_10363 [Streptomyces violarus]